MSAFYLGNGNRFLIVSMCSLIILASGCQKEEDPQEHLKKGVEYFNKGEYDKAKLELKTSNQSSKDTAETYYYLALLDEKNRQFKGMKENLLKNIELAPDHSEARLKLGKLHLLFGEIDAAVEQAEVVLKAAPDNLEAQSLKASALIRQKKYDAALAILDKILKTNPAYTDALSLKALILMEQDNLPAALELIESAIKADNKNVALYLFKIQLDAKSKNIDAVIADYKKLIEIYPDNQDFKVTLAKIYSQSGKRGEAEALLQGMVDATPDSIRPKLMLLDFLSSVSKERGEQLFQQYMEKYDDEPKVLFDFGNWRISRNELDQAKKVFEKIIGSEKNSELGIKAQMVLAKIAFQNKNLDDATSRIEAILNANSNYLDAKILQARIALVKERYDEAIDLLTKVLWSKQDSEEAMVLLGQAYQIKGNTKEADRQFVNALELSPANPQAVGYVYGKSVRAGNLKYAREVLDKALGVQPDNLDFLEKSARINMLENKWEDAQAVVKKIGEIPNSLAADLATFLKAEIYQAKGEFAKAVPEYKNLLENFPENEEALKQLASAYDRLGKSSEMISYLAETRLKNTNNLPVGILLADLYAAKKDFAKADLVINELIKNNPTIPQLYLSLARVKQAKNDVKGAVSAYQQGLEQAPGHLKLSIALASLFEEQGRFEEAVAIYEQLLAKNPYLEVAKNNLATLLLDHFSGEDKIKRALEIAEGFKNSDQPYYRDTYAWALVKSGKVNEGLDILNNIIINSPDVPEFKYHLAAAQYLTGNATVAMSGLQEAIALGNKKGGFPEQKAAEALLKEILAKRKSG